MNVKTLHYTLDRKSHNHFRFLKCSKLSSENVAKAENSRCCPFRKTNLQLLPISRSRIKMVYEITIFSLKLYIYTKYEIMCGTTGDL